jgi:hypothetical protein
MKILLFFVKRIAIWCFAFAAVSIPWNALTESIFSPLGFVFFAAWVMWMLVYFVLLATHVRRVRMIVGEAALTPDVLGSRHRRQIELPVPAEEGYRMVEAALRELPRVRDLAGAQDSLQLQAGVARAVAGEASRLVAWTSLWWGATLQDRARVIIAPHGDTCSATIMCEPDANAAVDWFLVDQAANLENIEALTRALTRRLRERRKMETETVTQSSKDKALAEAKLGLLHAQIEPHFLYNTLGSAKYLVRQDAAKAEAILDNLIAYLRHSLPRTEDAASTLGDEIARATAYLDILKIRMGDRLRIHFNAPDVLHAHPFPAMMLQTLVENAIKHGLEPKSGGGNVWVIAVATSTHLSVTVADDGRGLVHAAGGVRCVSGLDGRAETSGTGIGLNNIRERLKLTFGDAALLDLVSNYPSGVAATIRVPVSRGQ